MERFTTAIPLAEGATSEVFRATDRDSGATVALKVLRSADPELKRRFSQEAAALRRLDHPRIARFLDHGEIDGRPYLAMEFIDGIPFDRAMAGRSAEVVVRAFLKVVDALAHAHDLGLLHRDLKPENILVRTDADGDPEPMLVDFGLARDLALPSDTATGALMGTPAFMAPEQARGEPSDEIDHRTDIHGLGAVLYAALTGRPPYSGASTGDVIASVLQGPPRPPGPEVPRALSAILDRAMARDPAHRYRGARQLAADLEAWLRGDTVVALRGFRRRRCRQALARHPWRSAAVATVGVLVLALALQQAWLHQRATETRERAVRLADQLAETRAEMRQRFLAPAHDIRREMRFVDQHLEALGRKAEQPATRNLSSVHFALGRLLLDLGRPDEALVRLDRANELGCQSEECAGALATAHLQLYQRDLERRLESLDSDPEDTADHHLAAAREALKLVPQRGPERIVVAAVSRPLEDAERLAEARLRVAPWAFEVAQLLGDAYYRSGLEAQRADELDSAVERYRSAVKAFDRAATIARSFPDAYLGICRALDQITEIEILIGRGELSDHGSDLAQCRFAAKIDPSRPEAHTLPASIDERRAMLAYEQGSPARAEAAIRSARAQLDAAPPEVTDTASYAMARARVLATSARAEQLVGETARDRLQRSVETARLATQRAPDSLAAWRTLIDVLGHLGNADPDAAAALSTEAVEIARQVARRWPGDRSARNAVGTMMLHVAYQQRLSGRPNESLLRRAIKILSELVEQAPDYTRALNNLGLAWWDMILIDQQAGRDSSASEVQAREMFGRVLAQNPDSPSALINLSGVNLTVAEHRIDRGRSPGGRIERSLEILKRVRAGGEYLPCDFALAWWLRWRADDDQGARTRALEHAHRGETIDCRRVRGALDNGLASADRT